MEGRIVREIKQARAEDRLPVYFRARDVAIACPGWSLSTYNTFLAKHAVGNPGAYTEHFVRVARGLYCLIKEA